MQSTLEERIYSDGEKLFPLSVDYHGEWTHKLKIAECTYSLHKYLNITTDTVSNHRQLISIYKIIHNKNDC